MLLIFDNFELEVSGREQNLKYLVLWFHEKHDTAAVSKYSINLKQSAVLCITTLQCLK